MDTILTKKLKQLYDVFVSKVNNVYDIFKEYYTEERVDLQNCPSYDDFCNSLKTKTFEDVFPIAKRLYTEVNIPTERIENIHGGHIAITNAIKALCSASLNSAMWEKIRNSFHKPFILIHFPEVTVTNEYDQHIDIQDLFVKVPLMWDGTMDGNFSLNRATYSKIQYDSDYMHSHVPGINKLDFTMFLTPCLGTGPIRGTSSSLNNEYDEDLWNLFCLELDKYVKTESIEGIPYRRLSQVTETQRYIYQTIYTSLNSNITSSRNAWLDCFIKYLIASNTLATFYNSKAYIIAESWEDFCIKTSNAFIYWVNTFDTPFHSLSELLSLEILRESKKEAGKWKQKISYSPVSRPVRNMNTFICMFKGNSILLNVKNETQNDESLLTQNTVYTLNSEILSYIMHYMLYILNLSKTNGHERENTDIAHQNGLYL